jgi:hypothetical protein
MPIPSPSTMERLLAPYAPPHRGLTARVWAVEHPVQALGHDRDLFEAPKRFLCLGASQDGLVLVRQTGDTLEDLDGSRIGWERVRRLDREPHLTKDYLTLEVDGRPILHAAVSNHLLIPSNRSAAKHVVDMATRNRLRSIEHDFPHHIGPVAIA